MQIQGARTVLKIVVKKSRSLRLWNKWRWKGDIGNEMIDRVYSFTYLGIIIGKDGEGSEDTKSRIAKAQGVFSQLKKVWKNKR